MKLRLVPPCLALLALCTPWTAGAAPTAPEQSPYISHRFSVGETFSDVFSIQRSVQGDGFPETAHRNGGSATYVVSAVGPSTVTLNVRYRYDGGSSGVATVRIDARTFEAISKGGSRVPNTDASGLAYNSLVWGAMPSAVTTGARWSNRIAQPWELGPAGRQDVHVVSVVPQTGTITLERSGDEPGPIASDATQPTFLLGGTRNARVVEPGPMRWRGWTTFTRGIVIADGLLAERTVILAEPSGRRYRAHERLIMLLNALPGPT